MRQNVYIESNRRYLGHLAMFLQSKLSSAYGFFKTFCILLLAIMLYACASGTKNIAIDTNDIVISDEYGIDTDLTEKFNLAVKYINEKKFKDAIELLVEVTGKTDKHNAPYINLGIAYMAIDDIQNAEATFNRALKINPDHPVTNNEMGLLYRKTGRFAEAKKYYEKALQNYPQFLPARKNLGILCDLFLSDLDCAIENYEAYLKIRPNEKNMQIWLTDLKNRAGQ